MSQRDDLGRLIDELESLLRQSADLAQGLDGNRKRGIELRREIGATIARIGSVGEGVFDEAGDQPAFRQEFSKLRSAMAFHQASWPIVAVEPENPDYITSVQSLRETNRNFISWVRATLAAG